MKKISFIVLSIAGIFLIIFILNRELQKVATPEWYMESMTYLPEDDKIRILSLGYESTLAHYLWIRTLLYFGGHYLTDKSYPWLIKMLDIITRLSPHFYPPYEFAAVMLPDFCNNYEAARVIGERGIYYLGAKKWNLYFLMGMIYFKYYQDRRIAAEYFTRGALVKGAPTQKLLSLAKAFFLQSGEVDDELRVLMLAYETADNPDVKRHIAEKIEEKIHQREKR
ncbi:MAG: hypothetical protein N2053_00580 [Chitinispirillaceae bacterium]|nr:hypothetical protein [Chitinispirillaceae bacterium]